jgi:very-short-patch-repair endonuclease
MDELWVLSEGQYGVFARWQAGAFGMTWRRLDALVLRGILEQATRSVLRVVGAPRSPEQDLMIAVLDAGPGSAATLRASGWLWGLPGLAPGIHDVVRARGRSPRASMGIDHWPRTLSPDHITEVRGIATVALPVTLFQLAGHPGTAHRIGRLIDAVHAKVPSILHTLHDLMPQMAGRGRTGIVNMREALAERPPGAVPLTGLERRFEELLTSRGIAAPRRQVSLGGHELVGRVDYYDDRIRVIYEIDSLVHHSSLTDRRNDERRDAAARAAGFAEVVRIPEEHVWYEPWLAADAVIDARRRHRRVA